MDSVIINLQRAEKNAARLFQEIEKRNLLVPNKSEKELNTEIFNLAFDLYGIKKYWHKRIVRAGKNTLKPYKENPDNLIIQEDDILFVDFGPIFDKWEADFGRTYVLGDNKLKHKLRRDVERAWHNCREFYKTQNSITGAELFDYASSMAKKYGWEFGGEIAGHIIGHFPHERLENEDKTNYVHPNNHQDMMTPDRSGNKREWILEIHFIDAQQEIGGFFEQLLI